MRLTASRASITSSGGAVLDLDLDFIQQENPTLDLNFEETKTLTDDVSGNNLITFTRASIGTYVGSDGLIKSATTDAPRFGHDPVTGESLGLLIEETRTNYATQSANTSAWSATNGATKETFAAVTAPDGSTITQGFRMPNGGSRVYPTLSSPGTVEPVASIYARAVSGTATLNLFIQGSIVHTNVTVPSDSWVRINGTKASGVVTAFSIRGNVSQSEDVYLWGAQLEAGGSFPTSHILTSGSTVTRSPDIATIEGTNFSSWYNQSEGTVFVDANGEGARIVGLNDGTDSNRQELFQSGSNVYCFQKNANVNEVNIFTAKEDKTVFAYKANDYSLTSGGGSVVTDTSATPPTVNKMSVGNWYNDTEQLNGHIARLAYFPTRKTDQKLIDLTT